MEFARKILQNYGWKEGDGLGKNKNGIAKPIKANLKFDNAGFGVDQAADDFNNHWWERVFNEAATNVKVTQNGGRIKMKLKDEEDSVEITTKGYSTKKLMKLRKSTGETSGNNSYSNFLRAATLTNHGDEIESRDKIDTNSIEVSKVSVLTDDELFKACGGRTAHKGARHGLKLSGKLLRIEQQEAELLAKVLAKRSSFNEEQTKCSTSEKIIKQEKANTELSKVRSFETNTNVQNTSDRTKTKKIKKVKHNDKSEIMVNNTGGKEHDICEKQYSESKNKRKLRDLPFNETDASIREMASIKSKKNKKIKRGERIDVETLNMDIILENDSKTIFELGNGDKSSDNVKDIIKNKLKRKKNKKQKYAK